MFAPLIHAHTGEHVSEFGVHLSSLETYSKSSFQSELHSTEAIIQQIAVGVSDGVRKKDSSPKLSPDTVAIAAFFLQNFHVATLSLSCQQNYHIQTCLLTHSAFISTPQSPRAPPRA